MVVRAFVRARSAIVDITGSIYLATVCINRVTVGISRITTGYLACPGRAGLARIGQAAPQTANTTVGKCIERGLTAVVRIAVAITPQSHTSGITNAGQALRRTVTVGARVTTGTAIANIADSVDFTAVHSRRVTIGESGVATYYLANPGRTTLGCIWKAASCSTTTTIRIGVQGGFTSVVRVAVTFSPQANAGGITNSRRALSRTVVIGTGIPAASAIADIIRCVYFTTVSIRGITICITCIAGNYLTSSR